MTAKLKYIFSELLISIAGVSGIELLQGVPLETWVKLFWQSVIGLTTFVILVLNYRRKKDK